MTDDAKFAEVFAEQGGPFLISKMIEPEFISSDWAAKGTVPVVPGRSIPPTRSFFEGYYQRSRRWIELARQHPRIREGIPPTHFGFINNPHLNAVATAHPEADLIGVNFGTVAVLHALFSRLLCAPYCLPHTDPHATVSLPPIFGRLDHWESYIPSNNKMPGPLSMERGACAFGLAREAYDFLCLHEIGHLWNGHCDLWGKANPHQKLHEIASGSTDGGILRQCLEMDADAFALSRLPRRALQRVNSDDRCHSSTELSLSHLAFATYALWRLTVPNFETTKHLAKLTHFPAALRQSTNAANVLAVLETTSPTDASAYPTLAGEILRQVESAFAEMIGHRRHTDGFRDLLSDVGMAHASTVLAAWRDLHPQLEPLAPYEGLTPKP